MTDPLTAQGLARFSEIATRLVAGDEVPGVVAMAARGGQVHTETLGSLSVGGPPMREDAIFRLASMTKPMTGAATMALVAEGLLRLDEPVDRLLPELAGRRVLRRMDGPLDDTVPAQRAITVRDLLTFTFGFGATGEMLITPKRFPVVAAVDALRMPSLGLSDENQSPEVRDPDAWMAGLGSLPLIAQPGERWLYNTGAAVLGVLLARAAGQPFAEVLRTRIFEPLGMRDTGFWPSQTGRMATAYRWSRQAGFAVLDERGRDWSKPPAFCDGAAGLVSTAGDLLAFSRMLLRGGSPVLPADAVAQMTRDHLTPEQKARISLGKGYFDSHGWGLCMSVVTGGPDAGAYGLPGWFGTTWLMNPALDLTVIVLTQRTFDGARLPKAHLDLQAAACSAAGAPG
jgi:CubicO group peptidase (beta-lactamase class C family)